MLLKKNKLKTKQKPHKNVPNIFLFCIKGIFSVLSHNNFEQLVVAINLVVSSHPQVIAGDECCQDTATEQSHGVSQTVDQTSCALLFSQAG